MRPTDVLAEQRRQYEIAETYLEQTRWSTDEEIQKRRTDCFHPIVGILERANTYHVTADMTTIAETAGGSMPSQVLQEGDCPSPFGFLLYDRPLRSPTPTWPIGERSPSDPTGFMWARGPGAIAVVTLGRERSTGSVEPRGTFTWHVGEVPTDLDNSDDGDNWRPCLHSLLATWTVMQQSLAARETVPAARAERRRCARVGLPETVVVVRLRKFETNYSGNNETEVDWSHRWLVSGHWRNQYLPSRGTHRQQWISGYVKGPSDKPLVVKERVSTWVR